MNTTVAIHLGQHFPILAVIWQHLVSEHGDNMNLHFFLHGFNHLSSLLTGLDLLIISFRLLLCDIAKLTSFKCIYLHDAGRIRS